MVEILIGVWIICFLMSMVLVGLNYRLTRKKLESQSLKVLNANLEKVGLFWSNSAADFYPLTATSIAHDKSKTLRSTLWVGLFGLFSVLGFLMLLILVLSLHFLVRSRKEIATFKSLLATDSLLSKQETEILVNELKLVH